MRLSSFLKLVEIQTKVASVIPFLAGIIFALYRYRVFKPIHLLIYFGCLICVDMATTAINNYMDYKRAILKKGYNYESHNAIVKDNLKEHQVMATIIGLLVVGGVLGIVLFLMTDIIVLLIGFVAFGIGILYSFGPIPLSRTPFGELFSGIMMGGFILFVTVYTQIYEMGIINVILNDWILTLHINLYELLVIAVIAVPYILMIGGIMLANNICDLEEDLLNKRYTLPNYIGKKNGLLLFRIIYYITYLLILAAVLLKWLPLTSLLTLLTYPIVSKGIKEFDLLQTKKDTFVISVKNFVLISIVSIISILISIVYTTLNGLIA